MTENTNQNAENTVKLEPANPTPLYMDFANDEPPLSVPTSLQRQSTDANPNSNGNLTPVVKQERPDPRKEWINSDPSRPYFCKLCDYNMDCMEAFQSHCMGSRHVKRVIEVFNIRLPRKEDEEKKKDPPQFHCQVCLVTCNSDLAWNSHLLGQKHRKALEKQGAEKAQQKAQEKYAMNAMNYRGGYGGRGGGGGPIRGGLFGPGHSRKPYDKPVHTVQQPSAIGPIGARDFATYPEPLIGLEYVTEIQVIGQSPRYHCELCDSKFDHNLKFPHLVGSKHRFNVLKEKVPEVAHSIRGDTKKRSELSSRLLEEAWKLEKQQGRQEVKTRMEKSPFNRINNQMSSAPSTFIKPLQETPGTRGGTQPWQSQRGGRGGGRGRGKQQGVQYSNYNQQHQPQSAMQHQQHQPQSFTQSQQSSFTRGGRGRGRGSRGRGVGGNSQARNIWNEDYSSSYQGGSNTGFSFGSYSGDSSGARGFGEGDRMLPAAAFQPAKPQETLMHDMYYDEYYSGQNDGTSYKRSHPEQTELYSRQTDQQRVVTPSVQQASSNSSSTSSVSFLQGAIADLGKLVNNEEDASMALQVSNALTQALLQFRMQNLPQETVTDNVSGAGDAS